MPKGGRWMEGRGDREYIDADVLLRELLIAVPELSGGLSRSGFKAVRRGR